MLSPGAANVCPLFVLACLVPTQHLNRCLRQCHKPRGSLWWGWFDEGYAPALRRGGTRALVDHLGEQEQGEAYEREWGWARPVTLQADPEVLLAVFAPELRMAGVSDIEGFPVPALLITGDLEDEDDEAAKVAGMMPNGQSLRLPGLGHGGAMAASELTIPTARAFLDRWFA